MKRTRHCSECGRKIHLTFSARLKRHGAERPADHDLCVRCHRSLKERVVAARLRPMPNWAMRQRSTLYRLAIVNSERGNDSSSTGEVRSALSSMPMGQSVEDG